MSLKAYIWPTFVKLTKRVTHYAQTASNASAQNEVAQMVLPLLLP